MKLLGIAFFLLAVLCVCTVGEDNPAPAVNAAISAETSKAESVDTTASQAMISQTTSQPTASQTTLQPTASQTTTSQPTASQTAASQTTTSQPTASQTTLQVSVQTTAAIRATNKTIASSPAPSSPNAPTQMTQGAPTQQPVVTSAANTSFSITNTAQASGTQLAQNESLDASSAMGSSFSSTVSPERSTSASGTSGLPVSSATNLTNRASGNPESSSGDQSQPGNDIRYSNVILPIVITLIVITLSVFSLVALYKMCQKKTPERQENGAEQAQSDKEGVKLLSVKTTSPETGEHSSHGKNKTRQLFTSQQ